MIPLRLFVYLSVGVTLAENIDITLSFIFRNVHEKTSAISAFELLNSTPTSLTQYFGLRENICSRSLKYNISFKCSKNTIVKRTVYTVY